MSAYDPSYDVRVGPERPLISGQSAFQVSGLKANPPFTPAKAIYFQRLTVAAATKVQLYQNSLPSQRVIVQNESGGGDLVVGYDGVNIGTVGGNAFSIASGAALTIETEDAIHVWVGSVAGTTVSVMVEGAGYPVIPQYPEFVASPYAGPVPQQLANFQAQAGGGSPQVYSGGRLAR